MINLWLVIHSKSKTMDFHKDSSKFQIISSHLKKPKFYLYSWFAMNFKQAFSLYHDFSPFEDL